MPSSTADYKHVQVTEKGIYPSTASALALLPLSSPPPPHQTPITLLLLTPTPCSCTPAVPWPCLSLCLDYPTTQVIWGLAAEPGARKRGNPAMSLANQQTTYLKVLNGRLPKQHLTPIQKDVTLPQRLTEYRCTNTRVTGPACLRRLLEIPQCPSCSSRDPASPCCSHTAAVGCPALHTGWALDSLNPEARL